MTTISTHSLTNLLLLSKVLPQYRPQPDRAKKKEKYEESLRLIQELIDCDDFEDISTLRVSIIGNVERISRY